MIVQRKMEGFLDSEPIIPVIRDPSISVYCVWCAILYNDHVIAGELISYYYDMC